MRPHILLSLFALLGPYIMAFDVQKMFELDESDKKDLCVDLVFILDWSCSVAYEDFENMRIFLQKMINGMKIGPTKSQIGLVTFSDGAKLRIGLDEYSDKDGLLAAVDRVFEPCKNVAPGQRSGAYKLSSCCDWSTETWEALKLVREDKDLLKFPRKNTDGEDKARVVVLITDGVPRKRTDAVDQRGRREKGDATDVSRASATSLTIEEGNKNHDEGLVTLVVQVPNALDQLPENDDVFKILASEGNNLQYLFAIDDLVRDVGEVFRTISRYTCPDYCDKELDIVFIMDKSISISAHNIELVKGFFKEISKSLNLAKINIGMVRYNKDATTVFELATYSLSDVEQMIDALTTNTAKYTQTNLGLKQARQMLASNGREGVPGVGLLASDGITWVEGAATEYKPVERSPTRGEANNWLRKGHHIVIIGEPNYQEKQGLPEWRLVATPPKGGVPDQHIYNMQNMQRPIYFDDLFAIIGNLTRTICNIAA